jgi:hypothetical protein
MPNLTTVAKWAESLGISRQAGYDAIKRCDIPTTDGKVDPEYATLLYKRNTRERANGQRAPLPATAGGEENTLAKVPGYDTSRARREAAEAATAELKLAELAGKFLLKSDVENATFEIARALRDGLNNCARRIAAEVASLSTADECEDVIDRENRALLENLAHTFDAKLGIAVGGDGE